MCNRRLVSPSLRRTWLRVVLANTVTRVKRGDQLVMHHSERYLAPAFVLWVVATFALKSQAQLFNCNQNNQNMLTKRGVCYLHVWILFT